MALRIYNTRTGEKELFTPLHPGRVGMYVCGVTTYNLCHIGHGRASVVFDVVYRELTRRGFDVTYIRNYTDVDDKIIKRGHLEGLPASEIADKYVEATRVDMEALGCLPPTHTPRVTQHIDDIISLVKTLVERNHAYPAPSGEDAANEDVYFEVGSFSPYGQFSGRNLEDLRAGARVEVNEEKRSPLDFALWKAAKPGEPSWQSPWGAGRPGWHIECSAMCVHYLGATFDIHGGGSDLIFPHHENEIAQSEGANGQKLANYWMHNGMLTVNQEKMSKSLNNFFTIRDALERFHREAIRLFLLSTQYRNPADFSSDSLEEAEAGLERLYQAVAAGEKLLGKDKTARGELARTLLKGDLAQLLAAQPWTERKGLWELEPGRWTPAEQELQTLAQTVLNQLTEAMDDDFNTARALGHLFELARGIGRLAAVQPKGGTNAPAALASALIVLKGFSAQILGLLVETPERFAQDLNQRRLKSLPITEAEIEASIVARKQARADKNWAESDRIRDALLAQGIVLEDSHEGTLWKVVSRQFAERPLDA